MNQIKFCHICNERHFTDSPCPDKFQISDPDYLKTDIEVQGWNFEDALRRYAIFRELIPTNEKTKIAVKNKRTGEIRYCSIIATIEYEIDIISEKLYNRRC